MSAATIHITISASVDPLLRLRAPFTGDQEQMLADMRRVETLRRDPFDRIVAAVRREAAALRQWRQS